MSISSAIPDNGLSALGRVQPLLARLASVLVGAAYRCGAFLALLLAWHVVSRLGLVSAFLLPSPERVAATFVELIRDGSLVRNAAVSMTRVVFGYALAAVLAVPFAVLLTLARALRRVLNPPLEFLRQIPPLALIPLLILWLGIGEAQKLGVVTLTCFFPIFLGTIDGLTRVDGRLVEVGRVCGLPRRIIVWRIVLPAAMPAIVTGLRIALGLSWRALVGAELIAASAGLGYLIVDAQNMARTDIVLVGVVVIGALGMATDCLVRALLRRLMPWMRLDG
jgi:sulfonate transport system permease protein